MNTNQQDTKVTVRVAKDSKSELHVPVADILALFDIPEDQMKKYIKEIPKELLQTRYFWGRHNRSKAFS